MEKKVAIPAVLGELSPAKRRYSEKRGDLTRDFAPINWVRPVETRVENGGVQPNSAPLKDVQISILIKSPPPPEKKNPENPVK